MTRDLLNKKKRALARIKPVLDTDIIRYQMEMREWDAKYEALKEQEQELESREIDESLELMGRLANMEDQRANRLHTIETAKAEYVRVGLDRRYTVNKKSLQMGSINKIVDCEEQIKELGVLIEAIIQKQLRRM